MRGGKGRKQPILEILEAFLWGKGNEIWAPAPHYYLLHPTVQWGKTKLVDPQLNMRTFSRESLDFLGACRIQKMYKKIGQCPPNEPTELRGFLTCERCLRAGGGRPCPVAAPCWTALFTQKRGSKAREHPKSIGKVGGRQLAEKGGIVSEMGLPWALTKTGSLPAHNS